MDIRTLRRLALLLLLTWFCVDMTTPDIPGAFMFDADASVEVLASKRVGMTGAAAAGAGALVSCPQCAAPVPVRPVAFVPARPGQLIIGRHVPRRTAHPAHAPASPVEAD